MEMRTIKRSPTGTRSKAEVRSAVRGVHVISERPGSWEVRLLAPSQTKRFSSRETALTYARQVARSSRRKLYVHDGSTSRKA